MFKVTDAQIKENGTNYGKDIYADLSDALKAPDIELGVVQIFNLRIKIMQPLPEEGIGKIPGTHPMKRILKSMLRRLEKQASIDETQSTGKKNFTP